MKRNAILKLVQWKNSPERKPMVLRGARQVGKTWLMKEFGQNYYDNYVYFNFDEEDELKSIFETNKNPNRIIELLSMISDEKIEPETPAGRQQTRPAQWSVRKRAGRCGAGRGHSAQPGYPRPAHQIHPVRYFHDLAVYLE